MQVCFQKDYFSKLNKIYEEARQNPLMGDSLMNLKMLCDMLSALKVVSDLRDNEIAECIKNKIENTNRFDEIVISMIAKNSNYALVEDILDKINPESKSYYFTLSDEEVFIHKGIAHAGENFDGKVFFDRYNINENIHGWDLTPIITKIPPTNAMIVIDPYLLKPFNRKKRSVIEFINLFKGKTNIPFHFTAIISNTDKGNNTIVTDEDIDNAFNLINLIEGVKCQFVLNNNLNGDRMVFTNYTKITIGHPFDSRKTTYFTQEVYGVGKNRNSIEQGLKKFKKELSAYHNLVKNTSHRFTNGQRLRWESEPDFINRLFL